MVVSNFPLLMHGLRLDAVALEYFFLMYDLALSDVKYSRLYNFSVLIQLE